MENSTPCAPREILKSEYTWAVDVAYEKMDKSRPSIFFLMLGDFPIKTTFSKA